MEEEINYNEMRYILDEDGYILEINWGCTTGECTAYTGAVPSGYDSLEDWYNNANVRAYKIVDGNLVYDAERDAELQAQYELEASENEYATIGYVNSKFNQSTSSYDDTMSKTTTNLMIDDCGDYEIPLMIIEGKGDLKTSTGTITDAREEEIEEIIIEGKSVQNGTPTPTALVEIESVEGITNLLDYSTCVIGDIGSKGEEGVVTTRIRSPYIDVKSSTDYVCSLVGGQYTAFFYDANKTFISGGTAWITSGVSFATPSNCAYIRLKFKNNSGTTITLDDLSNVIFEKGSIAHSYVPYGRWLEQKTTGKNLFNKVNIINGYRLDSLGNNYADSSYFVSEYIPIKEKTNYVVNYTVEQVYRICLYDANKNLITVTYGASTFYAPENTRYLRLCQLQTSKDIIQLEEGNVATEYEPYKENTALIDMNTYDANENKTGYHEMYSAGSVKDTFDNGILTQRMGKVVLTGSETIILDSIDTENALITVATIIQNANTTNDTTKCNYLEPTTGDKTKPRFSTYNKNTFYMVFPTSLAGTSVESVKTHLKNLYDAGKPLYLIYALAEPVEHTLDYEPLQLFKGYNNVSVDEDITPNLNISYRSDITTLPNGIKFQVSNQNLLINEAVNETKEGITLTRNSDGTISLSGTATADVEFVLNGSMDNVEPIFMLNFDCDVEPGWGGMGKQYFYLGAVDVILNLYNYNGTDRTLIYSGNQGYIDLEGVGYITCSTLKVESGKTVNWTFVPSLTKFVVASANVKPKTSGIVEIPIESLTDYQQIKIDRDYIVLVDKTTEEEITLQSISALRTYKNEDQYGTLITANNLDLNIETKYFTELEFAGFEITTNGLTTEIKSKYDYTQDDVDKISNYLIGTATLTEEEKIKYDVSGDGVIKSNDALLISLMLEYGISTEKGIKLSICNNELNNFLEFIKIIDGNDRVLTNVGARGITTNKVATDELTIEGTNVKELITTEKHEFASQTLDANSNATITLDDIELDGYTALGMIMIDTNNNNISIQKFSVWGTVAYITFRNNTSSAQSFNGSALILYQKN